MAMVSMKWSFIRSARGGIIHKGDYHGAGSEAYKLDGTFLWRINLGKNIAKRIIPSLWYMIWIVTAEQNSPAKHGWND